VQWTGAQFDLQGMFNVGGGHLPPYLCSGLVVNLPCSVHRIRARSVRYGWWTSTTIFGQWTGDQFGLQGLFNMGGGHLPPYLGSGLVINLACKACSNGWWTSTTIFVQWTGDQFDLQGLFNVGGWWTGGQFASVHRIDHHLGSGLVINLACKACSIWVVDIYHHIWAVDW
jgi:hypothetical protein